jgi:hypothetical protein
MLSGKGVKYVIYGDQWRLIYILPQWVMCHMKNEGTGYISRLGLGSNVTIYTYIQYEMQKNQMFDQGIMLFTFIAYL